MNVFQIIKKYLIDNGYDGLCTEECGCAIDDLAACGRDFSYCKPGYRVDGCTCGCGCDFHIVLKKPTKEKR